MRAVLDSKPGLVLRMLWLAVQLVAVYWLGGGGRIFFYQGF